MEWAKTLYGVHLVSSASPHPDLSRWSSWQEVFPTIDSLLALSQRKGAIRTGQTFDGESKWLSFGRMSWSRKNNEKWTEKYRAPEYSGRQLKFSYMEAWAPDWNTAWRESRAPDVLVKLEAYTSGDTRQALLVAITQELYCEHRSAVGEAIEFIASLFKDSRKYVGNLAWAEHVSEGGFTNGLSDRSAYRLQEQLQTD